MTEEEPAQAEEPEETPENGGNGEAKKRFNYEGPMYVEGVMHLSKMDLMSYELTQAKAANLAQAEILKRLELEEVRRTAEEKLARLRNEQSQLMVAKKNAARVLSTAQKELAEAYGFELEKISYDDETGRVTMFAEEGDPQPILDPDWEPPVVSPDTEG